MPERLRLTLGSSILFFPALIVGLARGQLDPRGWWCEDLLSALYFLMVLGLLAEVIDIRRAMKVRIELTRELRFGAWFAMAWRVAVVVVMVAFLVRSVLESRRLDAAIKSHSTADFGFLWTIFQ